MAASPWAAFVVINCAGFGAELPRLTGTGRLRYAPGVGEFLAGMQAHAHEISAELAESGLDSARSRHSAAEPRIPEILL